MNFLSTLPMSLCIKFSGYQGGRYEVWSLKDIGVKTRFGPYKGRFITSSEQQQNKGFQWKVQTKENTITILDGTEESSWLRYINYATNQEEQNLIAVQHHSEVYFITCKAIPANTQLFVWYQDKSCNQNNQKEEETSTGNSLAETQGAKSEQEHHLQLSVSSVQSNIHLQVSQPSSLTQLLPGNDVPSPNMECNKLHNMTNLISPQQKNVLVPIEKPYECDICHMKFRTSDMLSNHQPRHTSIIERPYKCKLCDARFMTYNTLRCHEKIHTGEMPYQCEICKRNFRKLYSVKLHVRTHSNERPYQCDVCQKYYKTIQVLKIHKLKHVFAEGQFQCQVCNKPFYTKYNLTKHTRIHTGEKPYECDVCHRKFRVSNFLKIHQRIHTGEKRYKCQFCQTAFRSKTSMRFHERIHSGEKPYECKICHRKFRFSSPFYTHMKIHADKKMYQCEICNNTFTKRSRGCCKQQPFKCEMCDEQYLRYDDFLNHKIQNHKSTMKIPLKTK